MSSEPTGSEELRTRRSLHGVVLVLFAALATTLVLNSVPLRSANDRSRWSTVWSLVERGTYRIDEIDRKGRWRTIDKVRHRTSDSGEWHYYSTKPPLMPTLTAGVYYVVKKVTGLTLYRHTEQTTRLILLIINVLPMLLAMWLFSGLIQKHCRSTAASVTVLCAACFGTLLTPFLGVFNNHIIATTGVLMTLCFGARILIDGSRSRLDFALCGFLAMWSCCNELPAALFGLTIFWLLFRRDARRTLVWFAPAALIPLIGFVVTNYLATGGWKPFYMYYGTDRYVFTVDGVPSYWANPKGLDANTESPMVYLFHCVLGHHGILSLTPIFLLSAISLASRKSASHPVRPFLLPGLLLTIAVLAFYLSRTQNYNYGGNTSGLRWAFWLTPFWLVALIPIVDRWWPRRPLRMLTLMLLAGSVASAASAVRNPWGAPWLYSVMKSRGWIDYSTPPPTLERELRSWVWDVPVVAEGEALTVTWVTDDMPARNLVLTLTMKDGSQRLTVDSPPDGLEKYQTTIDGGQVRAGAPPAAWLGQTEQGELDAIARQLLAGLPRASALKPRRTQYLKTPLRTDAFECIQCTVSIIDRQAARWHRVDVWVTDEVPFGAVKVRTSVIDSRSDEILQRRTWRITSVQRGSEPEG